MKIVAYSDLKTNCIRKTTNKTTHVCGYSLDSAPSGDVTVSITISNGKLTRSPTSLTFTTANWFTPQIVTYTGVNDGVNDTVTNETITLSASGGGFDGVSLVQNTFVYDDVTSSYYYGYFGNPSWMDFYSSTNGISTTRANALNFIFNGSGLPSGYSTLSVSTGYTGTMHAINSSSLSGFSSIHRYTITRTDVDGYTWTHYVYHVFSSTGSQNKLFLDCEGHGEAGHANLINAVLALGIDVLYASMPVVGQNTENNPTITSTGPTGHNQFLSGGLDRVGYNPIELFLFEKVIAINYAVATYPNYSGSIYASGCSGGAQSAVMLAAIDTRISKTFICRGVLPQKMKSAAGDYEQGDSLVISGSRLYTDFYRTISSFSDLIILALAGGRYVKVIANTNDTTVGEVVWKYMVDKFQALATTNGGTIEFAISTNSGESTHGYQSTDITDITSEL